MKCIKSKCQHIFRVGHHYDCDYLLGSEGFAYTTKDEFGRIWLVREREGQYYILNMAEFVE